MLADSCPLGHTMGILHVYTLDPRQGAWRTADVICLCADLATVVAVGALDWKKEPAVIVVYPFLS